MKDELWLQRMKERLNDYSEPAPVSAWERLEQELSHKAVPLSSKRVSLYRRWGMVAAAVLLLAMSTVSLWFLQTPMSEEVRKCSEPVVADANKLIPMQDNNSPGSSVADNDIRRSYVAQHIISDEVMLADTSQIDLTSVANIDTDQDTILISNQSYTDSQTSNPSQVEKVRRSPSSKDKYHFPVSRRKETSKGKWSVALAVGNTGGFSAAGSGENAMLMQSSGIYLQGDGVLDLTATSNGVVVIPEGQEVVFRDGIPYLQGRSKQIASADHKQPVNVSFLVRKILSRGLSVETGLSYTFLASDLTMVSGENVKQKLHYLGIPLRANWSFFKADRFELYVSAGGMIEKCVYGKSGSETQTVKPLQFSVMGALGAQMNLSRQLGIYVEPGVSYYWDDHSHVQTIRKETPCNFTLQGGLRLTY